MQNQAAIFTSPLKADDANSDCFKKSLQELKHLSSQLHHAANYFQAAACRNQNAASQRKFVLESTRKYICEAIVIVVDHVGSVSYELENKFQVNTEISQVEQRIDCLVQRILTCQQYALTLDLSNLRWNLKFPRHHQHYIISPSTQHHDNMQGALRISSSIFHESKSSCKKDRPTITVRSPMFEESNCLGAAVPIPLSSSIFSKSSNYSIGTAHATDINILRSVDEKKKVVRGSAFLSLLRISRTKTSSINGRDVKKI